MRAFFSKLPIANVFVSKAIETKLGGHVKLLAQAAGSVQATRELLWKRLSTDASVK
jgi:hypothetical protein